MVTFAVSQKGASHVVSGLPCQDYSLSYESSEKDVQIVVVCDGHGSKIHVRSDVGARIAAESAKDVLLQFAENHSGSSVFEKDYGSGTVRTDDHDIDPLWQKAKSEADMTEFENLRAKQLAEYQAQIADHPREEILIRELCARVCEKWKAEIQKDSEERPFSDDEKECLGANPLEKAYGTTLMAYMRTPSYWLAIHIGDGRILCLEQNGSHNVEQKKNVDWKSLVPWDVNCFQNHTTSLCTSNAVDLFRYAFGRCGEKMQSPAVVFCCSDGIEDSFGDYDVSPKRLHEFYFKLLKMLTEVGVESAKEKMQTGFEKLSEIGSKDDMSLAGVVDLCAAQAFLKKRDKLMSPFARRRG